jgi:hypothetical protein
VADFPDESELAHTLLMLVRLAGGYVRTADTHEPLAKFHKISEKALSLKTAATGVSTWHTRVRPAREWLAKATTFLDAIAMQGWITGSDIQERRAQALRPS